MSFSLSVPRGLLTWVWSLYTEVNSGIYDSESVPEETSSLLVRPNRGILGLADRALGRAEQHGAPGDAGSNGVSTHPCASLNFVDFVDFNLIDRVVGVSPCPAVAAVTHQRVPLPSVEGPT